MDKFCFSCGAPLKEEYANKASDKFCNFCADENGKLKDRKIVQEGVAMWLKGMDPSNTSSDFMVRADHYLNAMPAWTKD